MPQAKLLQRATRAAEQLAKRSMDAQLSALQRATARSYDKLMAALAAAGKWDWQAFRTTAPFSAKTCASWMDTYCTPERQKDMMIMR